MRVSELAKELGKTSKEILEILQKNHIEVKTHSSNVSDEHIAVVKKAVGGGAQSQPAAQRQPAPQPQAAAQKPAFQPQPAPRTEGASAPAPAAETAAAVGGSGTAPAEAPKKKITAVYRPQNAQTMRQRPGEAAPRDREAVPRARGLSRAALRVRIRRD